MENKMNLYYDEEGDFLEISMGDISNCYFDNKGNGIFEIVDKNSKKIKGFALFSLKKRSKNLENLKITLPFGLEMVS